MKRENNVKAREAFKAHQRQGRPRQLWLKPAGLVVTDSVSLYALPGEWVHERADESAQQLLTDIFGGAA